MKRDEVIERSLESLHDVPLPGEEEQATARAAFLSQARELRLGLPVGMSATKPKVSQKAAFGFRRRFKTIAVISALALVVAVATMAGVVHAADGAVPGGALYEVDRAVEELQVRLTTHPERAVVLGLNLAEERLLEAEELSQEGNGGFLDEALGSYVDTISGVAEMIGAAEDVDRQQLGTLLDAALLVHEDQLGRIFWGSEPGGDDSSGFESRTGADPHAFADKLAELYDASYDDILTWLYDGYGFGEIILASETSEETGVPVGELLALKTSLGGWGLVWQELDLIGKPDDAGPPEDLPDGPPNDAGLPEDQPDGPPDDAGPPEDLPDGPPDDAGPPDDVPGGPADGAPPP
jgi:hypothetical protein